MVLGLLQKVAMTAAPDLLMQGGMRQFEQYAGAMTPQQKRPWTRGCRGCRRRAIRRQRRRGCDQRRHRRRWASSVDIVDVMRNHSNRGSLISFYAAGIGVMFLLFSSVAGAGGALLDEAESGTLERLLSTNIGMTRPARRQVDLPRAWSASLQLTVMFLWGSVAFGLPLFSHLPGFCRDDGRHRGGRRRARPGARDAGANARAALGLLDDSRS